MNKAKQSISTASIFTACIYCCISFSSCDTYNFSRPLPVDKVNIYEFPLSLRGKWIAAPDNETLYIYERRLKYEDKQYEEKIVTGAWPRRDSNGYLTSPPFWGHSLSTIKYDSLKRPIDTVPNYLLRGGFIYDIQEDSSIENGKPYRLHDDTIIVANSNSAWLDLGQNAFLRKVDNNLYAINILNRTIGLENKWWQVFFIEQNKDGSISLFGCDDKSEELPAMFYSKNSDHYFDSKWTAKDILLLKKQGYFSKPEVLVRDNINTGK